MNDKWEAISGHCPPSSAILDHLPYKSCWEVDIRSRRLLEANGSKWQPLEGINDYWGPSWVYWDWFLLEQLGAINVRACLPGSRRIVIYVIKRQLLYCFTYCLSSVPFFFIQTLSLISISFPEIELIFCETFKWVGKLVNCRCCHSHSEQCQKLPTCLPVCIILTWLFSSLITEFRAVAPPVLPLRPLRFVWRRSHYN